MSRIKEFPLPDLGEGLTEGEILSWLVAEGDLVELNQPIVEVETAKAAVEIPAKWAGKITKIHHPAGSVVEVGVPIVAIDTDPTGAQPAEPAPAAQDGGRTPVLVGYGPRNGPATRRPRIATSQLTAPAAPAAPAVQPAAPVVQPAAVPPAQPQSPAASGPVLAKPPVRKLARDLGIDLGGVVGTGPGSSITREDVLAAAGAGVGEGATGAPAPAVSPALAPSFGPDREQRVPIKGVRKLTAENVTASAFTAPHVTMFLTIDMTRSMRVLDRLRERPDWQGVRISPLLLVAKAVLMAVPHHPLINSTWSEATGEIVVKEYVNLGIAAATPRGLIVPNIKDAGRLSLRELADSLNSLVSTAKQGRTAPADMTGGTFTITNVGVFGIDTGTPILPPGETAILAFGAVREQPWVHHGEVRARQVTTLGMSFDHRVVDGELGSKFLREVGDILTDPATALLASA